jgi:hypothetical protein
MIPTTIRHLIRVLPVVSALALAGCGNDGDPLFDEGDTTPPAAPANLAIARTDDALMVSWDANSEPDLAGYVLQRSLDSGESWSAVSDTTLAVTSVQDDYRSRADYRVAAIDVSLNQSAYTRGSFVAATGGPKGKHPPFDQD